MKHATRHTRPATRPQSTLGDFIAAIYAASRNPNEAIAAVIDMLESGRVRITSQGRAIRAHVG